MMLNRQIVQLGLVALLLTGLTLSATSEARTVHEITADKAGITFLRLPDGNENILKVANTTDTPIRFSVPTCSINAIIPPHDSRNFTVNTIDLVERYIFYSVQPQGVAASASSEQSSVSSSSSAMETQSLDKIINYNSDYDVPTDPEPYYHESSQVQTQTSTYSEVRHPVRRASRRNVVRGYW